jgi:molecular chaperone GrpE
MDSDKNRDAELNTVKELREKDPAPVNQPPHDAPVKGDDTEKGNSSGEHRGETKKGKTKKKKKADLEELLKEKEEELKEKHDWLLRNQAEFENFKKRTAREKADLLKFGNESLMRELLPVIDNLERSIAHAHDAPSIDSLVSGIELIRKDLTGKLEKFGLKAIPAQGEAFDPQKHEATLQIETSDQPENTIVQELQKGYAIHDRLLRPAMVTVAKTPTTSPKESSDPDE